MSRLRKIGRSRVLKLADGRKQVIDRMEVFGSASDPATVDSEVFIAFGTAHPKYIDCLLTEQPDLNFSGDQKVEQDLVRVYTQMDAVAETQVGKLTTTKDANGRTVGRAQFIQLSSASATPGTIGTTTAPGNAALYLNGETISDNGAVRTVTRSYIGATASEVQVGGDVITKDENSRRTLTRQLIQLSSASYVEGTIGATVTVSGTFYALTGESKTEDSAVRNITRRYIEATSTLTQVGRDSIVTDENNRRILNRTYIQLSSASYVQGTVGSETTLGTINFCITGERKDENEAVRTVLRSYTEATSAEVQVGEDSITKDENDRRIVTRIFVQLKSASYVEGAIGSVITVSSTAHSLTAEEKSENKATRTISRRYVQATTAEVQVGGDETGKDDNGRRTIRRKFVQLSSASYVEGTTGASLTVGGVVYGLRAEEKSETAAIRIISREWIEVSSSEVQVGGDSVVTDKNNRHIIEREYIQLSSGSFTPGVVGVASITVGGVTYPLDNEVKSENAAIRKITRRWVEATSVEVQIGGDDTSINSQDRRTLQRQFIQRASASYVEGTTGASITVNTVVYGLSEESKTETPAIRLITRAWIEATTAEVQIGKDITSKNENERRTIERRYIQLSSAAYVEGTTGSALTVGGVDYGLTSESAGGDQVVRTITRRWVEATTTLTQIGVDQKSRDENGRLVIDAVFIQLRTGSTYAAATPGDAYGSTGCVFSTEQEGDSTAIRTVRRRYVQVTASLVEVGYPDYSRGDDDRKVIQRTFVILPLSAGAEPAGIQGAVGAETYDGCVCSQAQASQNRTRVIITKTYIQATDSPAQIGDVNVRDIDGAYKGTSAGAIVSTTKPAREFTYRYILSGDGTVDADWLALNVQFASTGRYYTGGGVIVKGATYSVIERIYTELPDTYIYTVYDIYNFPGKLGYVGNIPRVTQPPQSKQTAIRIEEIYSLGPVVATALTWQVISWGQGSVAFVPSDNNPDGETAYQDYSFSNYIGDASFSQTGGYFLGYKVSSAISNVASNPSTYPTGEKLISSQPVRWAGHGQIWKKVNNYVTFP